jgi:hypothetical protein
MSALRTTLTQLATTFADAVIQSLRGMSLDELVQQTRSGGLADKRTVTVTAVPVQARASATAPAKRKKSGRLERRSADDIAGVIDTIVALLHKHKNGLRAEEIRQSLGLEAKELPRPLGEALAAKRITKSGQKRATTYFVKAAKVAAKPAAKAKPAKAKSAKKAKMKAKAKPAKKKSVIAKTKSAKKTEPAVANGQAESTPTT